MHILPKFWVRTDSVIIKSKNLIESEYYSKFIMLAHVQLSTPDTEEFKQERIKPSIKHKRKREGEGEETMHENINSQEPYQATR